MRYSAYGLVLESAVPLGGLPAPEDGRDAHVEIRVGAVDEVDGAPGDQGIQFHGDARDSVLVWNGVGTARISRGAEIVVDRVPGADDAAVQWLVVGPALGILLTQRGLTALHASAVALDGEAAAFLGGSGWGKSTIAAALHRRGHAVVADDVVAVALDADSATVLPAHPHLKLAEDTLARLGGRADGLARVYTGSPKRLFPLGTGFSQEPLPLGRAYVLDAGDDLRVRSVRPHEAVVELVRHSWAVGVLHATAPADYLGRCTRLASRIPVRRLERPLALSELDRVAELVERDAVAERTPS
jgi:hypothetical protein